VAKARSISPSMAARDADGDGRLTFAPPRSGNPPSGEAALDLAVGGSA
jgi:hypothetical protein